VRPSQAPAARRRRSELWAAFQSGVPNLSLNQPRTPVSSSVASACLPELAQMIWSIPRRHAIVRGEDIGGMGPLAVQARLGDWWIPQRGIFAIGRAFLESAGESSGLLSRAGVRRP